MKKLIEKFVEKNENGLLLIDMPTGIGKSTKVIEFIEDYINNPKNKKKILYITGLKKNLNESTFAKKFKNQVLFLNNNTDTLIENYPKVKTRLPNKISSSKITKRLDELINIINGASASIKEEARNIIDKEVEREFRSLIEDFINFDKKTGKKLSLTEKKKLIKTEEFSWIKDLYPAVETDDKRILLMSMDKFLARNSTIIEPSYSIYKSKLVSDNIVFIDEFDATKDIVLKNIIKTGSLNNVNIIDLFRSIYAGLKNTDFTEDLLKESERFLEKKKKNPLLKSPKEIRDILKGKVDDIYRDYKLNFFHKIDESLKTDNALLFHDYNFKTILKEKEQFIYCDIDKDNKIVRIKGVDFESFKDHDDSSAENIIAMLTDIKKFINYFKNSISYIADNYLTKKNEDNNIELYKHYKKEAAIKTVLAEFCIEGNNANFLYELISPQLLVNSFNLDQDEQNDFSVYQKGFGYYVFTDNELYDTQSKIQYYSFHNTPEKFMLDLCRNSQVIGVSATSTLPSVISNYDITYLSNKLKDKRFYPDKEDKDRMLEYFKDYTKNYSNVHIEVEDIDVNESNYLNIKNEFSKEVQLELEKIFSKLKSFKYLDYNQNEHFSEIRYLKLFKAYEKFLKNHNIKSFLFLTSRTLTLNDSDIFNIVDASKIFNILKKENNIIETVFEKTLFGTTEYFEKHKSDTLEQLAKGEKGFIISSYQTLGAGQNIQYEIPEDFKENIVQVNNFDYGETLKDFDAIFIDKPRNIFARVDSYNPNNMPKEEILAKHIFQLKFLEEAGEIDPGNVENAIKNAIRQTYLNGGYKDKNPDCLSINIASARTLQQAIGRICRTKNKSKIINIFYDREIKDELKSLKHIYDENKLLNVEYKKLLEELCDKDFKVDNNEKLKNIALKNVLSSASHINFLTDNKWTMESISEWEDIRDFVLKNPTTNNIDFKYNFLYLELPDNRDYYYAKFKNSKKIENIIFDINPNAQIGEKYNYARANLYHILKIHSIKNMFLQNGYATFIDPAKYMLHPLAFDSIYKGAIGEVVGKYILEKEFNIELKSIRNEELYEKFDFYYNDIFIDFKNRNQDSKEPLVDLKIINNKLKKCNGKVALIINIVKPINDKEIDFTVKYEGSIIFIPYLYDAYGKKNMEAFIEIGRILNKTF